MPQYNPPLRDMHFVMHEVLKVCDDLKDLPRYAEVDSDSEVVDLAFDHDGLRIDDLAGVTEVTEATAVGGEVGFGHLPIS